MRSIALVATAALLFACEGVEAAKRTIAWEDEMCSNTLEFDDSKHDETALRNTIALLFGEPPVVAPSVAPVLAPDDVTKVDRESFDAACADALARAPKVRFVALPKLEAFWAARIDEIRDSCAFESAKMSAYREPSALRLYQPAAAACARFVDALEGKTDLGETWRTTIVESCRRNADPKACTSRNLTQGNGPRGPEWMRLYVLSFGWNNCAVRFLKVNVNAPGKEQTRMALQQQFERLFKIKKKHCEGGQD
jgi:hypothetical protein